MLPRLRSPGCPSSPSVDLSENFLVAPATERPWPTPVALNVPQPKVSWSYVLFDADLPETPSGAPAPRASSLPATTSSESFLAAPATETLVADSRRPR